jgi:hypothetical protein
LRTIEKLKKLTEARGNSAAKLAIEDTGSPETQ